MIKSNSEATPLTLEILIKAFDDMPKNPDPLKTILVPKSLYDKPGFKELARELGYEVGDD